MNKKTINILAFKTVKRAKPFPINFDFSFMYFTFLPQFCEQSFTVFFYFYGFMPSHNIILVICQKKKNKRRTNILRVLCADKAQFSPKISQTSRYVGNSTMRALPHTIKRM